MSVFNPETFLNTSTTEEFATSRVPVPEGEYVSVIKEIKPRQAKDKGVLDIIWGIDDPEVAELTGFASPQIRQSIFLDLTEQGSLAIGKGKNVALGKLREAVGQNQKGRPWKPGDLVGQVAKINVVHRMYEDDIQADVRGVSPLS